MRVLYIGHAYVVAENQKKIEALAQQPGVEVTLLLPDVWHDPPLHKNLSPALPTDAPYQVKVLPTVWAGNEQYYWYRSTDLGLRAQKPDVICIEQGAGAFVYSQSLIYRQLYAPQAKAAFFTWWNLPYRASWPLRLVEKFNLRHTQGAVAGNQAAAAILREHGYPGSLTVLPQLGVDATLFARHDAGPLRQQLGLDRYTIGYCGRFVEEKGIRVLLEALRGLGVDFQLLMIGGGPLEEEIRLIADQQGWAERLKIVKGVGHAQMPDYLNCMDVMVVPSLTRSFWMEQFGHVIIEALACEVPVIGSDSGEIPNVIGEAGLITHQGDVKALRQALTQLANSPMLHKTLGQTGRQRVLEKYTHDKIAQQLIDFLKNL